MPEVRGTHTLPGHRNRMVEPRREGNDALVHGHGAWGHYGCVNGVSRVSSRPSQVRERLIGALIPDTLGPGNEDARVLLAVLPTLRRLDNLHPTALLVSTSRMDRSGRVHERILLRELGWDPGSRVDMDTMHGMILIAATPTGQHIIDHRGAIKLPASLRRLCGFEYGPPLVLAAVVPEQVMVVHPSTTVAHLLAAHYTDLIHADLARADHDPADGEPVGVSP